MYWQLAIVFVLLVIIIPSIRARVHYFAAYFTYASVVFIGSAVYAFKFFLKGEPRYENSWLVFLIAPFYFSLASLQKFIGWLAR